LIPRVIAIFGLAALSVFALIVCCLFFRDGSEWTGPWGMFTLVIAGFTGHAAGRFFNE